MTALGELDGVSVRLKAGRHDNELTRFRYDVVLQRAGRGEALAAEVRELSLDDFSMAAVRAALTDDPAVLRVKSIRNDRLVRESELVRLLASVGDKPATAAAVRAALNDVPSGIHPADLTTIHPDYDADLVWSADGLNRFDLVLRSRSKPSRVPVKAIADPKPWSAYTNQPAQRNAKTLGPELRAHLRASLPEYMVPTAFVVLDALPRTPNGKIDRNALPEPDRSRTEDIAVAAAPDNDFERAIVAVWQDMLSLDAVGVETNLFDLGANSLMMVRAVARLSEALGRSLSLVAMFRFPTVRALAAHLNGGEEQASAAMRQSHERGQSRKDALPRRRDLRQGARPDRKR
jgi:acyl carrier protein